MPDFTIRNKIKNVLGIKAKKPLMEISFLGTGGAFNPEEGNSNMLIKTQFGNILIDCGFTCYPDLKKRGLVDDIKYVFITHFHEDHIGSLSTLLFDRFILSDEVTKIECTEGVKVPLLTYLNLFKTSGDYTKIEDTYKLNSGPGGLYEDINMNVYKVDTTGHHSVDDSSGLVFHFRKSEEDIYLVFSGDINTPFTSIIKKNHPELYVEMVKNAKHVFIFHEATAYDYPNRPHCVYSDLVPVSDIFPNIYTYHHGKDEAKIIIKETGLSSLTQMDNDLILEEKLGL